MQAGSPPSGCACLVSCQGRHAISKLLTNPHVGCASACHLVRLAAGRWHVNPCTRTSKGGPVGVEVHFTAATKCTGGHALTGHAAWSAVQPALHMTSGLPRNCLPPLAVVSHQGSTQAHHPLHTALRLQLTQQW